MATLAQVRNDIATLLNTISGLVASARVQDQITEWPRAIVGMPEEVNYDVTLHGSVGGHVQYLIPVRLYVGRFDSEESQIAMDIYVAPTGTKSIKAVVEAAGATSGWSYCNIPGASDFGSYTIAGQEMLGCEFTVEVLAA